MVSRSERFLRTFGFDLRSLGVLRICLGLMILVDLAIRSVDLTAHYSDAGVLPRAFQEVRHFSNHPYRFSFHMLSGDLPLQIFLFALSALFAMLLILGYRTRLSLCASVVLMISLQNRNAVIETGGDYLLRLVCFWCLFLPLGARFSLDHRAGRTCTGSRGMKGQSWFFSLVTVALMVQMGVVYVFSAVHKSHPIWRVHDSAIHYALHIDSYDTSFGEFLRQFPLLTTAFTRVTLQFEFYAIFFLVLFGILSLIPKFEDFWGYQEPIRTLTVGAFITFHLGLGVSLSLGTFAWFAALIWLGFLPTWAWDEADAWHQRIARSERKRAKMKAPTGTVRKQASPPYLVKLVHAITALKKITSRFEGPLEQHKNARPLLPLAVTRSFEWLSQGVVVLALAAVLLWNLSTVEPHKFNGIMRGESAPYFNARPIIDFFRLDQHWGLFAPYPRTSDGFYVVLGRKKNGSEIDYLRDDQKVTWEKPADVSGSYKTFRWRKYFRDIRRGSNRQDLSLYSDYVCSDHNATARGDERLDRVSVFFMQRDTLRAGGHSPVKKVLLSVRSCASKTRPPRPQSNGTQPL
jgi:hypothetical protein